MNKLKDFTDDLIKLLDKHEASLNIMLGEDSDTYGIYDEGIGVSFRKPLKNGNHFRAWSPDHRLSDGYSLSSSDIKERR